LTHKFTATASKVGGISVVSPGREYPNNRRGSRIHSGSGSGCWSGRRRIHSYIDIIPEVDGNSVVISVGTWMGAGGWSGFGGVGGISGAVAFLFVAEFSPRSGGHICPLPDPQCRGIVPPTKTSNTASPKSLAASPEPLLVPFREIFEIAGGV